MAGPRYGTPDLDLARRFATTSPEDDGPIWMVNLMAHRERADYGDGAGERTGEEADLRYAEALPLQEIGAQVGVLRRRRVAAARRHAEVGPGRRRPLPEPPGVHRHTAASTTSRPPTSTRRPPSPRRSSSPVSRSPVLHCPTTAPAWDAVPHPPTDEDPAIMVLHVLKYKDDERARRDGELHATPRRSRCPTACGWRRASRPRGRSWATGASGTRLGSTPSRARRPSWRWRWTQHASKRADHREVAIEDTYTMILRPRIDHLAASVAEADRGRSRLGGDHPAQRTLGADHHRLDLLGPGRRAPASRRSGLPGPLGYIAAAGRAARPGRARRRRSRPSGRSAPSASASRSTLVAATAPTLRGRSGRRATRPCWQGLAEHAPAIVEPLAELGPDAVAGRRAAARRSAARSSRRTSRMARPDRPGAVGLARRELPPGVARRHPLGARGRRRPHRRRGVGRSTTPGSATSPTGSPTVARHRPRRPRRRLGDACETQGPRRRRRGAARGRRAAPAASRTTPTAARPLAWELPRRGARRVALRRGLRAAVRAAAAPRRRHRRPQLPTGVAHPH